MADTTGFADTAGFREMVRLVAEDRAPRAGAHDPILDYNTLLADPDRFRGKPVKVRGVLAGIFAHELVQPAGLVKVVHRGFVCDDRGDTCIAFDLPNIPPSVRLRIDTIEAEGLFCRVVRYEAGSGRLVDVPYLIARSVTVLD